jgi:hypothetical protein
VEPERLIRLDSGKNLGKLDAMVTDVDAISANRHYAEWEIRVGRRNKKAAPIKIGVVTSTATEVQKHVPLFSPDLYTEVASRTASLKNQGIEKKKRN